MGNKLIIIIMMIFICGSVFAWEIEDINGTYVRLEGHLENPNIHEWSYSWGKGLSLTNASIEFDLGENEVLFPTQGVFTIESVYKDVEGSICLDLLIIGDVKRAFPHKMKVTFIDSNRAYIVHDQWEQYRDRAFNPEEKWVWYRLSGPTGD